MAKCICIEFSGDEDLPTGVSDKIFLDMPLEYFQDIHDEFRKDLASLLGCALEELPDYSVTEITQEEAYEFGFAPYNNIFTSADPAEVEEVLNSISLEVVRGKSAKVTISRTVDADSIKDIKQMMNGYFMPLFGIEIAIEHMHRDEDGDLVLYLCQKSLISEEA